MRKGSVEEIRVKVEEECGGRGTEELDLRELAEGLVEEVKSFEIGEQQLASEFLSSKKRTTQTKSERI